MIDLFCFICLYCSLFFVVVDFCLFVVVLLFFWGCFFLFFFVSFCFCCCFKVFLWEIYLFVFVF